MRRARETHPRQRNNTDGQQLIRRAQYKWGAGWSFFFHCSVLFQLEYGWVKGRETMTGWITNLTFADAAMIGLSAATVMLAIAALFVGGLAIFGYGGIKKAATESAVVAVRERLDEIADKEVEKAIIEKLEPKLNEILESPEKAEAFATRVFEQYVSRKRELEPEFDPTDTEER